MRAIIQRVKKASVDIVDQNHSAHIGRGLLVFLGVGVEDGVKDVDYMVSKTIHVRAFSDNNDKMNLSLLDINGEALVISQFTLYGDCRKGRRPSFSGAAQPESAVQLYRTYIERLREGGISVAEGGFQTMMEVSLINDGPVTFMLDSTRLF